MPNTSQQRRVRDPELHASLTKHPLIHPLVGFLGPNVWAVGGVVRDSLLGVPAGHDVDLVVEGDAIDEACRVGNLIGLRPHVHDRFRTATIDVDGGHVDFVTARRERYARPGALPDITPGTLADDLGRRDFTLNAIAVRVAGPDAGEVADPNGGRGDLSAGVIRMLRSGLFVEDPSRVVRAARYAGRLGFSLDSTTEREARAEAPRLDWSSARNAEELRRLLNEDDPSGALVFLHRWGAPNLRDPHDPHVPSRERLDDVSNAMGTKSPPRWALRLGLVVDQTGLRRIALPGWAVDVARGVAAVDDTATQVRACQRPSEVDVLLTGASLATLVALRAQGEHKVDTWWHHHRDLRIAVNGGDLIDHGVPPGPSVGVALRRVRAAVIDGEVTSPAEQIALGLRTATEQDL